MFTKATFGAISSDTMKPEHTLPAMIETLTDLCEGNRDDTPDAVTYVGQCQEMLGELERRMEAENYFDDPEGLVQYDWENLRDMLEEFAPDYGYFGTAEGDGACIGFFPDWDALNEINHVSDTSELASMAGSEALHVNDHGNATLYARNESGEWSEIWGVV